MKNTTRAVNHIDNRQVNLTYEAVNTCPICKAKIVPLKISASYNTYDTASVFDYCPNCHETFVTQYRISSTRTFSSEIDIESFKIMYSEPNRLEKESFAPGLETLSPQFVEVFNQAKAAEAMGLDRIAGLGYRKALEYLVKDYSITCHPDDEVIIKSMPLSKCIKDYIDDNRIKVLAEKSTWIGNDEAHYVRIHEDLNVEDLKKLLQAIVYFINMNLIIKEAEKIEPKKIN